MASIYVDTEVEIDPEDYMDAISTKALRAELDKREDKPEKVLLSEPPAHIIADLKRAFEAQNPHEFYYLLRKVERMLEHVDG